MAGRSRWHVVLDDVRFVVAGTAPVLTIAVTGGIGAGKSTVAALLADRGAIVIDSDKLAREVVEPGTPGLAAIVEEFGSTVLRDDGSLDRARLAGIVFHPEHGDGARTRLENITHPLVRAEFRRRRDAAFAQDPAGLVVNDIPILRNAAEAAAFDLVIVVVAPLEVRVARLVARGLAQTDARARIAAQISDAERIEFAQLVIPNDGDEALLQQRVDAAWETSIAPLLTAR